MNDQEARKVVSAARQIMRGLNKYTPWRAEEAEAELLLWAIENYKTLQPYLTYIQGVTKSKEEQDRILYTILRRYAWRINNKISNQEEEEGANSSYTIEDKRFNPSLTSQPVGGYTTEEIKQYLRYINTPMEDIPPSKREQVAIVLNGYWTCTPGQQEVLRAVAEGKKLKKLSEERGEAYQKLKGLHKRGMNNIKRAFKGAATQTALAGAHR